MVQVWFTLVQQPEPRLTLPSPTPPHPANFCPLLLSQGNDPEEPKGVTSEEFDKFLEERAKVADQLPNLSSPSAEGPPGPPPGTAPRKKTQEKDDDMLFAL